MRLKPLPEVEKCRITDGPLKSTTSDGNNGAFWIKLRSHKLFVIVSDGGGWDHVSVNLPYRTPSWSEMSIIKDLFWDDDETVVQFHPRKSEYVNCHPHTLHLWKNQRFNYQLPMFLLVGPK